MFVACLDGSGCKGDHDNGDKRNKKMLWMLRKNERKRGRVCERKRECESAREREKDKVNETKKVVVRRKRNRYVELIPSLLFK